MTSEVNEQVVFGYEIIERTRRGPHIPPEYSADGDGLLVRDGVLVEFTDPRSLTFEVLGPIVELTQIDPDANIVLPRINRSIRRYLDRSSIIHKELTPEQQDKVRSVSRVSGFRSELTGLLNWLEQPDEMVMFERINDQQLPSRFDLMRRASQILLRLPTEEVDSVLSESGIGGRDLTLEAIMKSYFMQPGVEHKLKRKQREPLDKTWQWYNRLGHKRRVYLLDSAIGISVRYDVRIRAKIAEVLKNRYYSEPFLAWFDADIDGLDYAKVQSEVVTDTKGDLHARLQALDKDQVQVDVVGSREVGRKRSMNPEELYDVLLKYRVRRDSLRAIIGPSEDCADVEGEQKSRLLGQILIALLFAQENTHISPEDLRTIRSIKHANPNERNARKIALGMMFTLSNAAQLTELATTRVNMVLESKIS